MKLENLDGMFEFVGDRWCLVRAKNKHPDLCATKFCRNPSPRAYSSDSKAGRTCSKCKMRLWRANNPVQAAYANLKNNASRRGISFKLTLEQFAEWVAGTDYLQNRGRTAESLTVDRIDAERGYELGNLQILTNFENGLKGSYEKDREDDNCPF
jgi:hypothetical protein